MASGGLADVVAAGKRSDLFRHTLLAHFRLVSPKLFRQNCCRQYALHHRTTFYLPTCPCKKPRLCEADAVLKLVAIQM